MSLARLLPWLVTAVLVTGPALAGRDTEMPALPAELEPMIGTWKYEHKWKKKKVPLYLVIKREDGKLRIRYQLPNKDKKFTSDWDGQIEVKLQVNMKEKREIGWRVTIDPPAIHATEEIRFTGTGSNKTPKLQQESVYSLTEDGKTLNRSCESLKQADQDKEFKCPLPIPFQRVSTNTKWPD